MSRIYDLRESIKNAVAEADIGLTADDIIIARGGDVLNKIQTVVSKVENGVALVINAASATSKVDEIDLVEEVTLKAELWVMPIYDLNARKEEDIFEPLKLLLHGLALDGTKTVYRDLRVAGWRDVPDPEYLIREITLKQRMTFYKD